jgi:cyclic pyranopterin phosphate synthase
MKKLTHLDEKGHARMVDISEKSTTMRRAKAEGRIFMSPQTLAAIAGSEVPKGDVLATARIAAIMAAKRTSAWIPLCHPVTFAAVDVDFTLERKRPAVRISAEVWGMAATGFEMEAMTAVVAAALTIYDMAKGLDKRMTITGIRLLEKEGGKSGFYSLERRRRWKKYV